MAHECEKCGRTFDTLTRLRLHDCENPNDDLDPASSEHEATTGREQTAGREQTSKTTEELDEYLTQVTQGNTDAIYGGLATFETTLESSLERRGGEAYRDVFWAYFEPLSDALDEVSRTEEQGWKRLEEITEAYDPTRDEQLPLVTPVIANAVGRHVIRTRIRADVTAIPRPALEYLDAVARNAGEGDDVALEEAHPLGWGVGHPEFDVIDSLRHLATTDIYVVSPILEHAFYADQHAAVEALEALLRDDDISGSIPEPFGEDMSHSRYLFDSVYGPATEDHWPTSPRYWDWPAELEYSFELGDGIRARLRDLIEEFQVDEELPEDYSLKDLAI